MSYPVFELLLTKQQEFDAYQGYLEAVRDYWLARVDLMRAVGAHLPSDSAATNKTIGPEEILHPPPDAGMQHMQYGGMDMPGMDMGSGEHAAPKPHESEKSKKAPKSTNTHSEHDMDDMPGMKMPPKSSPDDKSGKTRTDTDHTDSTTHDQHGGAP